MELHIEPSSAVPIYAQVVEQLRTLAGQRALQPGDRLPSVRELAASLRINRNTAAKAYQILELQGVLDTRTGQGTFIAATAPQWTADDIMGRLETDLDELLVKARQYQIPFSEVLAALERRIRHLGKPGRA